MEVQPHLTQRSLLRNAVERGSGAAVLSAAVLALCSKRDQNRVTGGLNGLSKPRTRRAKLSRTLVGYLVHYAESVFWGAVYTAVFRDVRTKAVSQILAEAASAGVAAYVVDYNLTPKRLQPGAEKHVSVQSMVAVYAGFALGLAAITFLRRNAR